VAGLRSFVYWIYADYVDLGVSCHERTITYPVTLIKRRPQ